MLKPTPALVPPHIETNGSTLGVENTAPKVRFPRLPEGKVLGKVVKRMCRNSPHLKIAQDKNSTTFEFRYEGALPQILRKESPGLYDALFKPNEVQWLKVLRQAYSDRSTKAATGGKTPRALIGRGLYNLFVKGVSILLSKTKDAGAQYEAFIDMQSQMLLESARRKPGRRRSTRRGEKVAVRLAQRHEKLRPKAARLKRFLKGQSGTDQEVLAVAAKRFATYEWLKHIPLALTNLPRIDNDRVTAHSGLKGKWAPWQLSVGIILCEEKERNPNAYREPITIYKYILKGMQLLKKPL